MLNFIGPNAGEGIEAFKDGALSARHQHGHANTYTDGDGRVVMGRSILIPTTTTPMWKWMN